MDGVEYYCDVEHFGKEKGTYICLSYSFGDDLYYNVDNKLKDIELTRDLTKPSPI